MTPTLRRPQLYDSAASEPVLLGTQCISCRTSFFPPIGLGCEVCGAPADDLIGRKMRATGVLHSLATVHHHTSDDIRTPFTVAEIQLDSGPLVRALMCRTVDTTWIGYRVHAVWVRVSEDGSGQPLLEPRFELDEGSRGGEA